MNIKTIAKMAVGVVGMGVAYVVSGKCGDYAKTAYDNRNNDNRDDHEGETVVIMEPENEISEDENED